MKDLLIENFIQQHPRHLARCIGRMPCDIFFGLIDEYEIQLDELASYISPTYLADCFNRIEIEKGIAHFAKLTENQAAVILRNLDPSKRQVFLAELDLASRRVITELIEYKRDQVGYYLKHPRIILLSHTSVNQAFEFIDKLDGHPDVIVIVDSDYQFLGTLNLVELIKNRHLKNQSLEQMVEKSARVIFAATPLENIIDYPEWELDISIPVVGSSKCFLGVISKSDLGSDIKLKKVEDDSNNLVNEYINFSEILWSSFHEFWGGW